MTDAEPLPPSLEPEVLPKAAPETDRSWMGLTSLILGIIGILAWCLPMCSGPLSIFGIILGALGLKESNRGLSMAGLVLNIVAVVLAIIAGIVYISLWSSGWFESFFYGY